MTSLGFTLSPSLTWVELETGVCLLVALNYIYIEKTMLRQEFSNLGFSLYVKHITSSGNYRLVQCIVSKRGMEKITKSDMAKLDELIKRSENLCRSNFGCELVK